MLRVFRLELACYVLVGPVGRGLRVGVLGACLVGGCSVVGLGVGGAVYDLDSCGSFVCVCVLGGFGG